jgi:hypothetical protein
MKMHKTMTACLMVGLMMIGMMAFAQSAQPDTGIASALVLADIATPAATAPAADVAPVPVTTPTAVASTQPAWERITLAILNSNAAITLMGALSAWLVAWMFTKKPAWKQYEGMMITAIKFAESTIPSSPGGGSQKAKAALDSFMSQYTDHYGAVPTEAVIDLVKASIPIVHDQLDAKGTL